MAAAPVRGALNHDRGQQRGLRRVWDGRAAVRTVLYMATVTAFRHNPAIRAFHNRLCQRGKRRKVAHIAGMCKRLLIRNAVIRDQCSWRTHLVLPDGRSCNYSGTPGSGRLTAGDGAVSG